MKRLAIFLMVTALAAMPFAPTNAATLAPGDLIKASGQAVYYYANDGKRYVFPTEKTYKSWYADFSGVTTITDAELATIQIGGNITYKPGVRLVKVTTDPKVYAIDGVRLRWVTSEAVAVALFGTDWASQVDDIPDAFFTNYRSGTDIMGSTDYSPATVRDAASIPSVLADRTAATPDEDETDPSDPTPPPASDISLSLTSDKTQAQINESIFLLAQATTSGTVATLQIFAGSSTLITSCEAASCSLSWTIPSTGVQESYTFRGVLTLADGRVQETTLTLPIVSMPVSPLVRITANRFTIKPGQLPYIHAIVEPEIRASRTDIYVDGVSLKTCSTTPHDCPYTDYFSGPVGTTFIVHAVVQTSDYLTYQSAPVTFLIAENDTPMLSLTPALTTIMSGESVVVTLTAEDDDGINQTEISYNGTILKTCSGAAPCSVTTGPWNLSSGSIVTFDGRATDLKGASSTTTASFSIQ